MAASLGSLVVSLSLDAAKFTDGLSRSEYQARRFAQRLDKEIAGAARLAAAGFVIMEGAILGAAYAVDRLVKQAANFKDIEEKTGASAESLASFSVAAQVAGSNMEDVGAAMNKLAHNLTGVDDESKAAGAALAALGINIATFKSLDPAAQFQAIGKALGGFQDGAAKSAVAIALLGKAGAQLLPFFKELESGTGRQAILTQRQIEQADEYADAQKRATAQLNLYAQAAAISVLPAITGLITAAKEFLKELVGVDKVTGDLAKDNRLREFAEGAAKSFAFAIDAADGLVRAIQLVGKAIGAYLAAQDIIESKGKLSAIFGEGRDQLKQISADYLKEADAILMRPTFGSTVDSVFAKQRTDEANRRTEDRGFTPRGKVLNFAGAKTGGGSGSVDDTARRFLDQQIKAQENAIRDEQELLRDRERFLQLYYQDDLISMTAYYDGRKVARDESLRNTLAAYDNEIAALQAFANNPSNKATDRVKAETDIAEAIAKRGRFEQDANVKAYESYIDKNRAIQQYKDSVTELDAEIRTLVGDERKAAEISFDLQNRGRVAKFTTEGDTQSLANVERLKKQALAQVDLNKSAHAYSLTLESLGIAQGRIALAEASGNITSLEAIRQRSAMALKYVDSLRKQADEQERLARTLVGPEQDQAIAKLERMRLEIDLLAESANELENTFRNTFQDAFSNGLTDAITGTKSLKEAFKDMEKQIVASISRMASQNIAESLFGKSGPAGGAPGFLASLFGGASSGGGIHGGGFGDAFIKMFGFSRGTNYAPGGMAMVGERGPELVNIPRGAQVIPNHELQSRRAMRGSTINQTINVMQGASRTTADQAAMRAGINAQRALARNG